MDPEQRFLQSRSSRIASETISTTSNNRNKEEDDDAGCSDTSHQPQYPSNNNKQQVVALFWKKLKGQLQSWKARCKDIETRQQWLDLQQELQTLRHYCLKSTNTVATTTPSSSLQTMDDWVVPDELPLADWRLLHEEFTNCTILLETIQKQQFPKTKFVFDRYRHEVARRQALGIAVDDAKSTTTTTASNNNNHNNPDNPTLPTTDTTTSTMPVPIHLESITNAVIEIRQDGSIAILSHHKNSNDDHWKDLPSPILSAVLLMKNLQNCTIQM